MTNSEIISQAKDLVKGRRWKIVVQLIIHGLIIQISSNLITHSLTAFRNTSGLLSTAIFWLSLILIGLSVSIISNFFIRNIFRSILKDVRVGGNKTIDYLNLFSGTKITGKRFLIATLIYTVITMLFFIPVIFLHLIFIYVLPAGRANSYITIILFLLAYIFTGIALYILMIFFTFYLFIEIDDPDDIKSVGEILKETRTLISGRKWLYVRLIIRQLMWVIILSLLVVVFFTVVFFIHPLVVLFFFVFTLLPITLILTITYLYLMPQVYYSQIIFYLDALRQNS